MGQICCTEEDIECEAINTNDETVNKTNSENNYK